jgi:hypothetical protein
MGHGMGQTGQLQLLFLTHIHQLEGVAGPQPGGDSLDPGRPPGRSDPR